MIGLLSRFSTRRPLVVIGVWVLAVVVAGGLALDGEVAPGPAPFTDLLDAATTAEFRLSDSAESRRADILLAERLRGAQPVNEVVIFRSETETVDSPHFRAEVEAVYGGIAALGSGTVTGAFHYYQTGNPALVSADRRTTIMPLVLAGSLDQAVQNLPAVLRVVDGADGRDGFRVLLVGEASIAHDYNELAEGDLRWGERIGVPVALVILLVLFGTVTAALVPLGLALVCIIVALGLTALIGQAFDLIFLVTLMVVMIGLAVGIDYSLLIVSRFRDELARGLEKNAAVERACAVAGRTVLFSGVTVVVALCGLLIVPFPFFQSMGLGAILVVLVSLAATLTLLPAILALLGPRINRLAIPFSAGRGRGCPGPRGRGFWGLATRAVTRAPVIGIIAVAAPMVAATVFAFQIQTGVNGVDSFPEGSRTREAFFIMEEQFSFGLVSPTEIVIDGDGHSPPVREAIARLQGSLRADGRFPAPLPQEVSPAGDLTLLTILVPGEPRGQDAIGVVTTIRDRYVPAAFEGVEAEVVVGGATAEAADFQTTVRSYTPAVFAFVLGLSFLILMLVFRSVVVPAKAVIMNLLSVGAAFGLMVLVFQKGVAAGLLGLQPAEVIDVWIPLLMFSVLFGLSMDYHVFLLRPHPGALR